jgi:integrase
MQYSSTTILKAKRYPLSFLHREVDIGVRMREDTGKYVIDYYDNLGKRHIETAGTNKREAVDKLTEKMNQIRTGTYRAPGEEKTFKEFAEKWLAGKVGIKDATKTSYEGIVNNHLIPYFGAGRIGDLKRENIRDFVKAMVDKGELSSKSIHNILLVLHQTLDDAQIEGLIHRNPYLKIEKPKREKPEVDYLRTHEIPAFLDAARTYKEPKEKVSKISKAPGKEEKKKEKPKCETTIPTLFFTAIFTGMRRGELLGLQWSDIDWVNSKIHVRRSLYKGGFQTQVRVFEEGD